MRIKFKLDLQKYSSDDFFLLFFSETLKILELVALLVNKGKGSLFVVKISISENI